MDKSQILKFFKAPFGGNCFIAYFFIVPLFFALPFFIELIKYNPTPTDSFTLPPDSTSSMIIPIIMSCLTFFLVTGFAYMVAHGISNDNQSPFDVTIPYLPLFQIPKGFFYSIAWTICCILYFLMGIGLSIIIPIGMFYISQYLPTLINVLLWIVIIPLTLGCFVFVILNLFIGAFSFIKKLDLLSCFKIIQNYHVLKLNPGNILRATLFVFVASQITHMLFSSILTKLIIFGTQNFSAENLILWGGILAICGFFYVYLTLLQMIILAKTVTWISINTNKNKN